MKHSLSSKENGDKINDSGSNLDHARGSIWSLGNPSKLTDVVDFLGAFYLVWERERKQMHLWKWEWIGTYLLNYIDNKNQALAKKYHAVQLSSSTEFSEQDKI